MRHLRIVVLLVLGGGLLTAPQTAGAADDGPIFDPGSPAGKEYAIPLDQARREAGGGGGPAGGGGGANQALFGAGITPEPSNGGSSGVPGGSGGASRAGTGASRDGRNLARGGGSGSSARSGALSGVEEGLLTIGGGMLVVVLALGSVAVAATGLATRRRSAS